METTQSPEKTAARQLFHASLCVIPKLKQRLFFDEAMVFSFIKPVRVRLSFSGFS
jgi:hypothetical protein